MYANTHTESHTNTDVHAHRHTCTSTHAHTHKNTCTHIKQTERLKSVDFHDIW
jgi:hypothetical protein